MFRFEIKLVLKEWGDQQGHTFKFRNKYLYVYKYQTVLKRLLSAPKKYKLEYKSGNLV